MITNYYVLEHISRDFVEERRREAADTRIWAQLKQALSAVKANTPAATAPAAKPQLS
jgi:hypothetical protein